MDVEPTTAARGGSAATARLLVLALAVAAPIGLLLAGAMIWQSTQAAYTGTSSNAVNAWSTGNVFLADDDGAGAVFDVGELAPGATGERCMVVHYQGTVTPATVRLYVTGYVDDLALADHLTFTVHEGGGGGFPGCSGVAGTQLYTGTLGAFARTHTSHATGVSSWSPAGTGATQTYRFAYEAGPELPESATARLVLTWQAQS